jgi:hypothetical protein
MFVLAIDIAPIDRAAEYTIWRFSHDHEKAEDAWYRLADGTRLGTIVRDGKERVKILGVRLYDTTSADRAMARELVQAGEAKALLDSDNALTGMSGDQLRQLNDIIKSISPDENAC